MLQPKPKLNQLQYKFYATLLDTFQGYLSSSEIYQEYWGFSEDPKKTEHEFEQEQFDGLINTINRVPFESEPADKGTAFNEVIDCLIDKKTSDKMEMKSDKEANLIVVKYKQHTFQFSLSLCLEFAKYFEGALTQQRTEAVLPTKYGNVLLYGYMDELMPFKCCDIKTTSKYNAFKFKRNWQHLVYPYCLTTSGIDITAFEYTVTDFKNTWTELYNFNPVNDIPRLTLHVERLIEFIEQNKSLITDAKIFALDELEISA